jgi:heptosyltransferase-2
MPEKLLVLAPNWLGDAVMALPAIADVRRGSGAPVTVAARPPIAPLFAMAADVNSLIVLDKGTELGSGRFDVAILLPNSFGSALLTVRAGIRERWGYRADWRGPLLTRAVRRPRSVHQVDYYQSLTTALGFSAGSPEPRLEVTATARQRGADLLRRAGWNGAATLVALAPGAAYGSAKRWPPRFYADLAASLDQDGAVSVLVGGPADRSTADQVISFSPGGSSVLDLVGATDLEALAGVLVHCRTLVTNDSGAMHVAAAAGVPVTAIFGPTRERETAPRHGRHVVMTHAVWCRPCMNRECPLDHECMRGVRPEALLDATRRVL